MNTSIPKSSFQPLDLHGLKTYELKSRPSKVFIEDLGHPVDEKASVGDWIEYQNLGKSVIVVRSDDGVKAFHNACRHRGVPIAGGKGNGHGNCKSSGRGRSQDLGSTLPVL